MRAVDVSQNMKLACYLCGSEVGLTKDHIPPKGFFPDPKPTNLITVECCRLCNQKASLDDEAFRIWVTSPPDVSAAGKWVQKNKVFEGSLKRGSKLVDNVRKFMFQGEVGSKEVDLIAFPQDRAESFLIRLTKGLLAYFYSDFPRNDLSFRILNATLLQEGWDRIAVLRDQAIYDSRGDEVFQFRRRVSLEKGWGYWMYSFYGASLLMVWHEKAAIQSAEPAPESGALGAKESQPK